MSIWADQQLKDLLERVKQLEQDIAYLKNEAKPAAIERVANGTLQLKRK